jgi:hypothetical protein
MRRTMFFHLRTAIDFDFFTHLDARFLFTDVEGAKWKV